MIFYFIYFWVFRNFPNSMDYEIREHLLWNFISIEINKLLFFSLFFLYLLSLVQIHEIGTICSGIFCLCLGIPRFSQHDGARARIGSFFVNTFVGIAQAFTLIFCLVGWGWSIWWGMIMLRTASKLSSERFHF